MNSRLFKCDTFKTPPVGPVTMARKARDSIDMIAIGFSYKRRYYRTFYIPELRGNKIEKRWLRVNGHAHFKLGFKLFKELFKFGKLDISNFISLKAYVSYLVDFGNVEGIVKSAVKLMDNATEGNEKATMRNILKLGRQCVIRGYGRFSVKLKELSGGFLFNIGFTLSDTSLLITRGDQGVKPGIYFLAHPADTVTMYINMLKFLKNILSKFGLEVIPKIPPLNIALYFFINTYAIGIKLNYRRLGIECMVRLRDKRFSCRFDIYLFTMIWKGIK